MIILFGKVQSLTDQTHLQCQRALLETDIGTDLLLISSSIEVVEEKKCQIQFSGGRDFIPGIQCTLDTAQDTLQLGSGGITFLSTIRCTRHNSLLLLAHQRGSLDRNYSRLHGCNSFHSVDQDNSGTLTQFFAEFQFQVMVTASGLLA